MTRILLVRHAQASFGAEDYDKLSELGHAQARHLGTVIAQRAPALSSVWHGTLRRHRETAAGALAGLSSGTMVREDSKLNEFDHLEVLTRHAPDFREYASRAEDPAKALAKLFHEAMMRWIDGAHDADYGESWSGFRDRSHDALRTLAAQATPGHDVVAITSGGVITTITQSILGLNDLEAFRMSLKLVNGGLTSIRFEGDDPSLEALNEHDHFAGEHSHLLTLR